jgi:hypothetical protein
MILSKIIGTCPTCGTSDSFGNVSVSKCILNRGCTACGKWSYVPLPQITKSILYLDQFFFSHAFRDSNSDFAVAISLISHLAHHQLIVVPFSPTHKIETNQWPNERKNALWEFIKRTSRGHQLLSTYNVRHNQIARAYRSFLDSGPLIIPVQQSDITRNNFNEWENYIWIDVEIDRDDPESIRANKKLTVDNLIALFETWRKQKSLFEDDREVEFIASAQNYFKAFITFLSRIDAGDPMALVDSPLDSLVIENMLRDNRSTNDPIQQLKSVSDFFASDYFRHVPYERIFNGTLAVLKHRVKMGQYSNSDKARDSLTGFYFDVDFISGYLPYCNAMFIDQSMFDMVSDSRLSFQTEFGTKLFSRSNWGDFLDYLASIEKGLSLDVRRAVQWIYPEHANGTKS